MKSLATLLSLMGTVSAVSTAYGGGRLPVLRRGQHLSRLRADGLRHQRKLPQQLLLLAGCLGHHDHQGVAGWGW